MGRAFTAVDRVAAAFVGDGARSVARGCPAELGRCTDMKRNKAVSHCECESEVA